MSVFGIATLTVLLGQTPSADEQVKRPSNPVADRVRPNPEGQVDVESFLQPIALPQVIKVSTRPPLTLRAILDSVEQTHPKLAQSRQKLRETEGKLLSAEGAFDLNLSFDGFASPPPSYYDWFSLKALASQPVPILGLNLYGGWRLGLDFDEDNSSTEKDIEIPDYDASVETFNAGEVFGGLSLNLWKDRDIDEGRKKLWQSRQAVSQFESELMSAQLEISLKAAEAYWDWAASGRAYAIAANLLELASLREKQVRQQYELGSKARFDVLESRRSVLKRASELIKAQRKLEKAAIKLSLSLRGEDSLQPVVPQAARLPKALRGAKAIQERNIDRAISEALESRPELRALDAERRQAALETRFAENTFAPKVEVGVEVSKDVGRLTNDPDNFSSQASLEPTVIKTKLKIELPAQFRKARGQGESARAVESRIAELARGLRDQIMSDVRDAYSALDAAERALGIARASAVAAGAVAEAERERFRLGTVDQLSVNLREQQFGEAQTTEAFAEASLQVAYARIRRALAVDPATW